MSKGCYEKLTLRRGVRIDVHLLFSASDLTWKSTLITGTNEKMFRSPAAFSIFMHRLLGKNKCVYTQISSFFWKQKITKPIFLFPIR